MNKKNIIITCLFGLMVSGAGGCPLPKGCEKASVYNPPTKNFWIDSGVTLVDAGVLDSGMADAGDLWGTTDCWLLQKCTDCVDCCDHRGIASRGSCEYFCDMQGCEQ